MNMKNGVLNCKYVKVQILTSDMNIHLLFEDSANTNKRDSTDVKMTT